MAKIDASVLSFEKKLVVSDCFLYGTNWDDPTKMPEPLKLKEKSVRGTISNRLKADIQKDPLKIDAEVEKANLQKVDACSLSEEHDTLQLNFTLKVLGNIAEPSACNGKVTKSKYSNFCNEFVDNNGFQELSKRYATNIANARFLWRNRVGAEKVKVVVSVKGKKLEFNSFDFSLKDFNKTTPELEELAKYIADALCDKLSYLLISVTAYALIGKSQEVYPSEELVLDKGRGDKSKILYEVNDVAAMHSQKIGNALRTVDTWYDNFETEGIGPLAAEPYAAVTTLGRAFRYPKNKTDFFTLFDEIATTGKLSNSEQADYVMAVIIRGGVFGESSKE